MSLNANDIPFEGKSKTPDWEPGTYPARIVGVAVLGLQDQGSYLGQEKPPKREIHITYEFLDEFLKNADGEDDEEKPRWLSERFPFNPLKSQKAKSTIRYNSLDPEGKFGGDFSRLVDMPCTVTIATEKGKDKYAGRVFANVSNVSLMRAREADKARKLVNPPFIFDFYNPTHESWEALPDWMKEVAKKALDFHGGNLDVMLNGGEFTAKMATEDDDNWDSKEENW